LYCRSVRLARHAYEVPGIGRGELWLRHTVLVHHDVRLLPAVVAPEASVPAMASGARRTNSPTGGDAPPLRIESEEVSQECCDFVADLCRRFGRHLLGRPVDYADVELDLDGRTALQRALAVALRAVPWGEVVTYGELAALAGRPGAARAAGAFCAESTWSLVVPCHRVVAAGGIGGYGATGTAAKRRLLALEGVEL
jgi:methylated-DNA-[protein]-cysteine S-methyltransferase